MMSRWVVFGVWGLCMLVTSASWAQTRVHVTSGYVEETDAERVVQARAALESGATNLVRSMPEFSPVSDESVSRRLEESPSYLDSLKLAASWSEMGITKYRELDPAGAIQSLEQAVTIWRSAGWDLIEPQEFSQTLLFLALSHLEKGENVARPLELMQEMVRLNPALVIQEGYYPQSVVQFYEGARLTLERSVRDSSPVKSHADRLAVVSEAELVLFVDALQTTNTGWQVIVHLYDVAEGEFQRETLSVGRFEDLEEAASRLASRLLTCRLEPEAAPAPIAQSQGESPWSMQIYFAYASFLDFPDPNVELFGHYGAAIGANYSVTREFSVLGAVQVLTSARDFSGFIIQDFTTIRGFGGIELGYSFGPIRPEIAALVEASTLGDIVVCEDVNTIIRGCNPDRTTRYEFEVLLGANIRPRVSLQLLPSLTALIGASGSFYVYPLTERQVNFPVTVETGVQYRF